MTFNKKKYSVQQMKKMVADRENKISLLNKEVELLKKAIFKEENKGKIILKAHLDYWLDWDGNGEAMLSGVEVKSRGIDFAIFPGDESGPGIDVDELIEEVKKKKVDKVIVEYDYSKGCSDGDCDLIDSGTRELTKAEFIEVLESQYYSDI